jgi:hypothetical protein
VGAGAARVSFFSAISFANVAIKKY